jgi:hypothetical protein
MPIDVPRDDYRQMLPRWKRMRDLLEGEDAVKAAGTSYLRRLGGQSDEQYSDYRDRALFYPAVARTLRAFLGLAFKKNPVVALLDRARVVAGSRPAGDAVSRPGVAAIERTDRRGPRSRVSRHGR